MSRNLDFDLENLPWLDRHLAEIDEYVDSLDRTLFRFELREKLLHWLRFGFVKFENAIEHELIDSYLEDIDLVMSGESNSGVRLQIEGLGIKEARHLTNEELRVKHLRVMDMHNISMAGKCLSLHPVVTDFLGHVFRQEVVAMQSLTFIHGTEQRSHQDFAYVRAGIPSHLAASWIALEDVDPDAGPLFYLPGSHMVQKFDWGNGLFLTPESSFDENQFADFLEAKCAEVGLNKEIFCPKKGDIFFWHAGLVHGGSPTNQRSLTRKSYVTHYSSSSAYKTDRRAPDVTPTVFSLNGGSIFADPINPSEENRFQYPR